MKHLILLLLGVILTVERLVLAQSPLPDDFSPRLISPPSPLGQNAGWVYTAFQAHDGKIWAGGEFRGVSGVSTGGLARFNANGSPDASVDPAVTFDVLSMAVQPDMQLLIAGDFKKIGSLWRTNIARLNYQDATDSGFNPGSIGAFPQDVIYCLALQTNRQILVGGQFQVLAGKSRYALGRLEPDGNLDTNFAPNVSGSAILSIAIQANGKVLIGGVFTTVAGYPRHSIARLNPDGSVDPDFHPGDTNIPSAVTSMLEQPDGKILIGGNFKFLAGAARTNLARVNSDGSIDPSFNPNVSSTIDSMTLQADGRIIISGNFATVGGQTRQRIARINSDGSLDETFNPPTFNGRVYSVSLQTDGKTLVGGAFTSIGTAMRTNLARLNATDSATQSLQLTNGNLIWLRGGTCPEAWRTTFEHSIDGVTWTNLGAGERIPGGWQISGNSITNGAIRARGYVTGGQYNASSWFVESLLSLAPQDTLRIVADSENFEVVSNHFSFEVAGPAGQNAAIDISSDLANWSGLKTNTLIGGSFYFSDPDWQQTTQRFYRARLVP